MIIDATDTILGRLATHAAKQALLGEDVIIINAEKAIVSGRKQDIFKHYRQRYARGVPSKGPFIHRMPDRLVRRTVRGMLPYKTRRGLEAYRRVMCYAGVPEQYKDKDAVRIGKAEKEKLPSTQYATVKEIARNLGGHS
ncbi:50S ribosomal protein L13 [Candidatus Woesearchaeota archaeon]|nr:50S ribosomal protein L13 [Candidatus Woesearchaeota archaeon]